MAGFKGPCGGSGEAVINQNPPFDFGGFIYKTRIMLFFFFFACFTSLNYTDLRNPMIGKRYAKLGPI